MGRRLDGDGVDTLYMQATAYSLLGFETSTRMSDRFGRPQFIAGDGRVRHELLG